MRRIPSSVCAGLMALPLLVAPFGAGVTAADAVDPDRYTLKETPEGWLRLDRETGRVSLCRARYGRWTCAPVPDAVAAFEDEARALEAENARLAARVAELERRLQAAGGAVADDDGSSDRSRQPAPHAQRRRDPLITPHEEREIDRFMEMSERVLRRFFSMVKTLRRDLEDRT